MRDYTVEIAGQFTAKITLSAANKSDAEEKALSILHNYNDVDEDMELDFEQSDIEIENF